jgi:uncharacterized protein with von Willebrand factor type A (vWA) domain
MENSNYKKADLLVISDFVLEIKDGNLRKTIENQKLKGNRFYALSIGHFRLENVDDLFNLQWNYDEKNGTISQLNNVVEWVSGKVL